MKPKRPDKPDYAARIAHLRKRLNLKQIPFAHRLQVDQGAVSNWERGKNRPHPEAFVKLAGLADGPEKLWFLGQAGITEPFLREHASRHPVRARLEVDLDFESLDTKTLYYILQAATSELEKRDRRARSGK